MVNVNMSEPTEHFIRQIKLIHSWKNMFPYISPKVIFIPYTGNIC